MAVTLMGYAWKMTLAVPTTATANWACVDVSLVTSLLSTIASVSVSLLTAVTCLGRGRDGWGGCTLTTDQLQDWLLLFLYGSCCAAKR